MNIEVMQKELKKMLSESEVWLTFTKKDGSERKMHCTTMIDLIPADKRPSTEPSNRKTSETSMPVFDLDINEWRSFRWDSVVEFGNILINKV